jgi:hypothetical protein
MSSEKREHHEVMSVEVDGRTHAGTMIVRGTRKLTVSMNYLGNEETDGRSWGTSAEERFNMRQLAKVRLLRMVLASKRR